MKLFTLPTKELSEFAPDFLALPASLHQAMVGISKEMKATSGLGDRSRYCRKTKALGMGPQPPEEAWASCTQHQTCAFPCLG